MIANLDILVEMQERSAQILEALVREFIASGEPVSSGWLFDRHDFGIKPAMIRAELSFLTDQGYLEQPHHSAGRVPTDRAYELFAQGALEQETAQAGNRNQDQTLQAFFEEQAWEPLLEKLSRNLGILSVLHRQAQREVYKEGLEALIDRLDWQSRSEVKEVIHDFEALEERLEKTTKQFEDDPSPRVFIGKQSPVTKSEQLSVMMQGYTANGEKIFLFAIGPKRMDYEKIARILKGLEMGNEQ